MSGSVAASMRGGLPVTAQQAAVVDHVLQNEQARGVTVVTAGAGAGKTHTLVAVILEIIDREQATADQIILITFTRQAADELRHRIDQALELRVRRAVTSDERRKWQDQQEKLSAAYVGTIHGFCRQALRDYGYEAGVGRDLGITFSTYLRAQAMADVLDQLPEERITLLLGGQLTWQAHDLGGFATQILDTLRNRGVSPEQVAARTHGQTYDRAKEYRVAVAELVAAVEARYQQLKQDGDVLDPADLLSLTARVLRGTTGDLVAARLSARYRFLVIDEFQDTDRTQLEIARRLQGAGIRLVVVGDRKQGIYTFRAADGALLDAVAREFGVTPLSLSISRRPTQPLLRVQNALFTAVARRYPRLREPLEAWEGTVQPRSGIAPLTYLACPSATRMGVTAQQIRRLLGRRIDDPDTGELRPVRPGDIVLLVRSNYRAAQYEQGLRDALQGSGVEVRQETGGAFYRRPEVLAVYRMLRLILRYPDDTALALALRTPYLSGIRPEAQEQHLLQYGTREGSALTDWLEDEHPDVEARLRSLRADVRSDTVPPLLARLYEAFAVERYYRARGDLQALENLEKLREVARRLFQREQALTLRQFADFLQTSILTAREEREAELDPTDAGATPPYIRIMTIHRAKGLQFPLVIIPEVQAALTRRELDPRFLMDEEAGLDLDLSDYGVDTRSPGFIRELQQARQARLEEEMRVLYVAVTRAQHAVTFVGDDSPIYDPSSDRYSWKDEILAARPDLVAEGAVM